MKAKILGIVGSLQTDSQTRHAMRHVLHKAEEAGAETQLLDLKDIALPIFNPEKRDSPAYDMLKEKVIWSNALLLGSPDYHGCMSGAMKNFLDYFWREFGGKLFGYLCASHEKGLTAMDQMRTAVRQCYGWSLPYGVSITKGDFDPTSGLVSNPKIKQRLESLGYDLATYAPLLAKQFESDVAGRNSHAGFAAMYQ
jgi:NAD(P)H-dependent FMN reductase